MFKKARLKLSIQYTLVILLITSSLSAFIYAGTTRIIERQFTFIENRIQQQRERFDLPTDFQRIRHIMPDDLESARKQLLFHLLLLNGSIALIVAAASYYLAGETLKPIEQAVEEQKRFVADASHELKTPLTALKTSLEVAKRNKKLTTKQAKHIFKENIEEINNMTALTNNLLSLAKFQHNGALIISKFDMRDAVDKIVTTLTPLANTQHITLRTQLTKQILHADRDQIHKLLTILLENAIKYSYKHKTVTVRLTGDTKHILLTVKDQGIGIDKKHLPFLFDRFYRVDESRSKHIPGFGLGLSLAKQIVKAHKGSIHIESKKHKGTTVSVKLLR